MVAISFASPMNVMLNRTSCAGLQDTPDHSATFPPHYATTKLSSRLSGSARLVFAQVSGKEEIAALDTSIPCLQHRETSGTQVGGHPQVNQPNWSLPKDS